MEYFTNHIKTSTAFQKGDILDEHENYDMWIEKVRKTFYRPPYIVSTPLTMVLTLPHLSLVIPDFVDLISVFLIEQSDFIVLYEDRTKQNTQKQALRFIKNSFHAYQFTNMRQFFPKPLEIFSADQSFYLAYTNHGHLWALGTAYDWLDEMQNLIYKYLTPVPENYFGWALQIDHVEMLDFGETLILYGRNVAISQAEIFKIIFSKCTIETWHSLNGSQGESADLYHLLLSRPPEINNVQGDAIALINTSKFSARLKYHYVDITI